MRKAYLELKKEDLRLQHPIAMFHFEHRADTLSKFKDTCRLAIEDGMDRNEAAILMVLWQQHDGHRHEFFWSNYLYMC